MVGFWLACTAVGIGIGFWWFSQNLPNGPREQAALILMAVAALAFRLGMLAHR